MISAPPHARILVASKPVDFRKGLPGLSALVETVLQEDPFICVGRDYVAAHLCSV
jgi:transposase